MNQEGPRAGGADGQSGINNPHDSFFHVMMDYPETHRAFFAETLPVEVLALVDLETIEVTKDHFVNDEMRHLYSDKVFTVKIKGGYHGFLYLLLEHQSKPDPMMAFRLLQYVVALWAWWLREHPNSKSLPPVFPMVVYSGKQSWHGPLKIQDLVPEVGHAVFAPYPLLNLAEIEDERWSETVHLFVTMATLRHVVDEHFPLDQIMVKIENVGDPAPMKDLLNHFIGYILQMRKELTFEKVVSVLDVDLKEDLMTLEQYIEKRAEAKAEAREKESISSRLLAMGMAPEQVASATLLSLDRVRQLQQQC